MSDQILSTLARYALEQQMCLVLGAGLNKDLGLPLWGELLDRLSRALGLDADAIQEPTLLFDLLNQDSMAQACLADCLYRVGDSEQHLPKDWVKTLGKETALSAVADLVGLLAELGWRRDFHVITYNMDLLLEEILAEEGYRVEAIGNKMKIRFGLDGRKPFVRIYHPHGIVCRPGFDRLDCWPKPTSDELDGIFDSVLGRNDYGKLYSSPLDSRNVAQLSAFQRDVCLFFGFSFRDPSVERLLRLARSYKVRWRGGGGHVALVRNSWRSSALRDANESGAAARHEHVVSVSRSRFTELGGRGSWLNLEHRITRHLDNLGVVRIGWHSYQQQRFIIEDLAAKIRFLKARSS